MKNLYIFDCYGVLLSPISVPWMKAHYPENIYMEKYHYFMDGVDLGERSFDEVMKMISDDTGIKEESIRQDWFDMAKPNFELLDKIIELREHHCTALLSNAPSGLIEKIFADYGLDLDDYFDEKFISANYHMMKPDIKFYQLCLSAFKDMKFDHMFMVDDRLENINHLPSIGITPVLHISNKETIEKLTNVK